MPIQKSGSSPNFDQTGLKKEITPNNWKQALVPEGAIVVDNHNGTAPG